MTVGMGRQPGWLRLAPWGCSGPPDRAAGPAPFCPPSCPVTCVAGRKARGSAPHASRRKRGALPSHRPRPARVVTWVVGDVLTETCRVCGAEVRVELVEGAASPDVPHGEGCPVPQAGAALDRHDLATVDRLLDQAQALAAVVNRRID